MLIYYSIVLLHTLYCFKGVKTKLLSTCINYCHFMLFTLFNAINTFTLYVYHQFLICLHIIHMLLIVLIKPYYTNYRRQNKGTIHMLNHNIIQYNAHTYMHYLHMHPIPTHFY